MNRFLLTWLFLGTILARAATGDITGIMVETNGWICNIWISGLSTNGTFSYGLGPSNNITGSEKLVINLTSLGYDATGTATTRTRTLYGTYRIRFTTPTDAFPDTVVESGNLKIKVALSEFVYSGDTAMTATIASGLYTGGSANSAASAIAVTNNSTMAYPKVIANWTWPGWNRETGANMRLRAVGFHASARDGKPLALMRFIATDESGDQVISDQTDMRIDSTLPDLLDTGEYYADISQTTFASLDRVRCDFIAFPWIGDTNAVLSTTVDTYTQPTPLPAAITNLCDRLNVYTDAIAVVDPAGNDTNGQITNVAPASVSSGHYFLTIAGAVTKTAAYNNSNFSHNDAGGGVIYVRSGITNWTGATHSVTAIPRAWTTVKNYPGDTVTISFDTGTDDIADRVKIEGLKFTLGNIFSSTEALWFNGCTINTPATAFAQTCKCIFYTHCTMPQLGQGIRPFSAQATGIALVRGNNLDGQSQSLLCYTVIGNIHPVRNYVNGPDFKVITDIAGMLGPVPDYIIVYNNYFGGMRNVGANSFQLHQSFALGAGIAIAQNVFEHTTNTTTSSFEIGTSNSRSYTNVLLFNNVLLGAKNIVAYNDSGSVAAWRIGWTVKNNLVDDYNIKSDTFPTANANRVGNWAVLWNVGSSGNVFNETTGVGAAGIFLPEFSGLNSISHSVTAAPSFFEFYGPKRFDGIISDSPGGGDYRTHSSAPQHVLVVDYLLPFDIAGQPRTAANNIPGVYAQRLESNLRSGVTVTLTPGSVTTIGQ